MADTKWYFRYKNGTGDCFESLATRKTSHLSKAKKEAVDEVLRQHTDEDGTYGLFYVGFFDGVPDGELGCSYLKSGTEYRLKQAFSGPKRALHDVYSKGVEFREQEFEFYKEKKPNFEGEPKTIRDDDYIAWIVGQSRRDSMIVGQSRKDSIRLFTFSSGYLFFWKIVGEGLEVIMRGEGAFESIKKLDADKREDRKWYKFLRVECEGKVRRQDLYTSIDSLAVYRWLTQGTCRPIWKIKGSFGSKPMVELQDFRREIPVKSAPPSATTPEKEHAYGTFVRMYFDAILNKQRRLPIKEKDHLRPLAIHSMNPILVETCAYYFCLDLGFETATQQHHLLPDVGKGKGLDVIDVRARLHPPKPKDSKNDGRVELIVDKLKILKLEEVARHFQEHQVVEIQCKARTTKEIEGLSHVVLFVNGTDESTKDKSASTKRPTLDIQEFLMDKDFDKDAWPMVHAFISMQVSVLNKIPRCESL